MRYKSFIVAALILLLGCQSAWEKQYYRAQDELARTKSELQIFGRGFYQQGQAILDFLKGVDAFKYKDSLRTAEKELASVNGLVDMEDIYDAFKKGERALHKINIQVKAYTQLNQTETVDYDARWEAVLSTLAAVENAAARYNEAAKALNAVLPEGASKVDTLQVEPTPCKSEDEGYLLGNRLATTM
jgi:hypothetical protein